MQNHMPYDDYYSELNYTAEGTAVIPNRRTELQTYMQGLHYVPAVKNSSKKSTKSINRLPCFYGDHLPAIYSGNDSKNMD